MFEPVDRKMWASEKEVEPATIVTQDEARLRNVFADQQLLAMPRRSGPAYSQCLGWKFAELDTVLVCEGTETMKAPPKGDIGNRAMATPGGLERYPDSVQTHDAKVGERSKTVRLPKSAT